MAEDTDNRNARCTGLHQPSAYSCLGMGVRLDKSQNISFYLPYYKNEGLQRLVFKPILMENRVFYIRKLKYLKSFPHRKEKRTIFATLK